jgi:DNA-binding CsgD family transcriptional regulator
LDRLSGKPDFALAIAPLTGQTAWLNSGPIAFVLITDPDAASTRPGEMITKMFGLTASETRVAERLMLGDSPEQAASSLGLKISTARWHLRSMYRKTGASGQTQLVRLLLSVPTI